VHQIRKFGNAPFIGLTLASHSAAADILSSQSHARRWRLAWRRMHILKKGRVTILCVQTLATLHLHAVSTPTSSAVVSTPFATAKNPFCNLGEFNGRECPARSLPAELRDLQLGSTWTIEFNEVPDDGVFTKNHITSRVSFVDDYIDEQGTSYPGAMVSMELADDIFEVVDNGEVSTSNDPSQSKSAASDLAPS